MKKLILLVSVMMCANLVSKPLAEVGVVFTQKLLDNSQAYSDMLKRIRDAEMAVNEADAKLQKVANEKMAIARQALIKEGVVNEKDPRALSMQLEIEKQVREFQDKKVKAEIDVLSLRQELTPKFADLRKEAATNVCKELKLAFLIEDTFLLAVGDAENYRDVTDKVQQEIDLLAEKKDVLTSKSAVKKSAGLVFAKNEKENVADEASVVKA